MKKIANILLIIFIIVLFYLTREIDILPLTISFSIYILLSGIYSKISLKKIISKNNTHINVDKAYGLLFIIIFIIGIIQTILVYFIGTVLDIDKIGIVNIFMSISLISTLLFNITCEYLELINYKKASNNLSSIYIILVSLISMILTILLFKIFKFDMYINISLLYSVNTLVSIILNIYLYILIIRKRNIFSKSNDYKKLLVAIKDAAVEDSSYLIYGLINGAYIYISIIILYYVLTNMYGYDYQIASTQISNTYFYGLIIIYFIYINIKKHLSLNFDEVRENFNSNISKILKLSLIICILLTILSRPVSYLLLKTEDNIISSLIPLLFVYLMYAFINKISIDNVKDSKTIISLIIGIIVKTIFEVPFINTTYRMGVSLVLGSTLSTVLGMIVCTFIELLIIRSKFKINLLSNFNNILNIVYESIIYALVMVISTLIVKIEPDTLIESILVIIFYIFITLLYFMIKRLINKK